MFYKKRNSITLMKRFIRISFQVRKNFILDRFNVSGFNNINHAIVIRTPIYVSSPNNNRDNPIMKHACTHWLVK